MPSFGRIDGQKCEATEPPGARTSLPILPINGRVRKAASHSNQRVGDYGAISSAIRP
jgi:hypothetical protein